ncbi:MAG: DNA cytosine methyltransferase [Candidatus Nomurabacteria bacterium]|jgi:DNA (cytosine-5)-methyltransferase 1|nr:DNA cytosine methyltransferase [Candidatus Nomurabacteria bacterium]
MTDDVKFIDLFAGIGGFHMAFHNAGGDCVFASEWDDAARKTYEANYKKISPKLFETKTAKNSLDGGKLFSTPLFAGDITKVDPNDIPDHDVLTGGFPCQPFSQAGFKKGFEDTRGTLFFNVAEILKTKKPRAFFLENVRGLLNHNNGETIKTIERVLREIGYSFDYKIVRASDFGLPQHRPRLYMVGFRDKPKDYHFIFPEPTGKKMTMSDVFDGAKVNKEIGFTLRVGGRGSNINDRRNWDSYLVDGEVRRIYSKEGKRMQGFPDNFEFPVSEVQAMKQLGNSVAVPAIQAVAQEIVKELRKGAKNA